jgi:hypothetical protein
MITVWYIFFNILLTTLMPEQLESFGQRYDRKVCNPAMRETHGRSGAYVRCKNIFLPHGQRPIATDRYVPTTCLSHACTRSSARCLNGVTPD